MVDRVITIIRNGYIGKKRTVRFKNVRHCIKLLDVLTKTHFIYAYFVDDYDTITVYLKYHEDGLAVCNQLIVVSKPRDRIYLSSVNLFRASKWYRTFIVSTSIGIMDDKEAVEMGVGGEVLVYVA